MARSREDSDNEEHNIRDSVDILQEEEDREQLLTVQRSAFRNVFTPTDPNTPRTMTRRGLRRQKKREKKSRRRRKKNDGEVLYEMEEGKSEGISRSSSSSRSSTEIFLQTKQPGRRRLRRVIHFALLPGLAIALFVLLVLGAIKTSTSRKTISPDAKIPKALLSNGTSNYAPTTILISLDGFRADFLNRGISPTLNKLIAEGVSPEYMFPSFPSLTFPNHWTFMTGLHPESHGIVGNTFWDPTLEEEFYYTDPLRSMQPKWWTSTGAEPLWSTCEKQGIRTAIHMWPGSEAGISPEPQTIDKYNGKEDLTKKAMRVLSFLDRPSEYDIDVSAMHARPQFIAMYVPNVDSDGHKYGPNSTEIRRTIQAVDKMMGVLLDGINARNLTSIVNIVVVSDHGMATTSTSRLIQLDDLVDPATIDHTDGWPLYGLRPKPEVDIAALYQHLVLACQGRNVTPYLREGMPERYHFLRSERIAPVWLIPDPGYAIVPKSEFDVAAELQANAVYNPRGLHGYDNQHPLMRAIFIARGPAFPHIPNSKVEVFQNTEIYNIVADSLGVVPIENNGTLRLPLKTVGLHGDAKSEVEDLPPNEEAPITGDKVKDHPQGWVNVVSGKLNDLQAWFKGLLEKYHW